MPYNSRSTLPLSEARAALAELGFLESTDTPLLGASTGSEGMVFTFLHQGVDADGVIWHHEVELHRRDLATLCSRIEDVNRPEPEFDLEQQAMTDPKAFAKIMRDKRRAERTTLNDGPTSERGRLTCFSCKHLSKKMVKTGLRPVYNYFCNHSKLQGQHFVGTDDRTPFWCPADGVY